MIFKLLSLQLLFLTLSAFKTGTDFSLVTSLDSLKAGPVSLAMSSTGHVHLKLLCLEPGGCSFDSLAFVKLACHLSHEPLNLMGMTLSSPHLACGVGVQACRVIGVPDVTGQEFETTIVYGGKIFRGYMEWLDRKNVLFEHRDLTRSGCNCVSWQWPRRKTATKTEIS